MSFFIARDGQTPALAAAAAAAAAGDGGGGRGRGASGGIPPAPIAAATVAATGIGMSRRVCVLRLALRMSRLLTSPAPSFLPLTYPPPLPSMQVRVLVPAPLLLPVPCSP